MLSIFFSVSVAISAYFTPFESLKQNNYAVQLIASPTDDGGAAMNAVVENYKPSNVWLIWDGRTKWLNFFDGAKHFLDKNKIHYINERIQIHDKDYSSFVRLLDRSPVDVIVCLCFDDDALEMVTQLRGGGYIGPFLGTDMTPIGSNIKK